MNSAADSNHTCYIYPASNFNGDLTESLSESERYHFESKANRQKKIYRILSHRNRECSNVQHFSDVPIELLPEMLTSIQQYSEYHLGDNRLPDQDDRDVKSLSVVYEIMRKWDQAISLYE